MACLMQGSGIPEVDMTSATIKINEDGSFNLIVGATDLGTGSDTILAQIAAEVLSVENTDIIVYSSDTDLTPFDVEAYASSTTFISANAVKKTAEKIREMIIEVAAKILNEKPENLYLWQKYVVSKSGKKTSFSQVANTSLYYYNQHQIIASASHTAHTSPPPFSVHFADIEVDSLTGKINVKEYVSCIDCRTAINPTLPEGQNDVAVVNGISNALAEQLEFSLNGTPLNANFRRYRIFTARDIEKIRTILIPTYEPNGLFGAKSVSEIGINGPLPAINNAIYDVVGVRLFEVPFTPDKVLAAIEAKKYQIKNQAFK